jgi:glycerol-3-phosphate dehydrogenase
MPNSLDDVLARRTRALFLNARASSDIAPETARIMANELGFDQDWQKEQTELFVQLAEKYM